MTSSWVMRSIDPVGGNVDSSRAVSAVVVAPCRSADVPGVAAEPFDEGLEDLDVLEGLGAGLLVAPLEPRVVGAVADRAVELGAAAFVGEHDRRRLGGSLVGRT